MSETVDPGIIKAGGINFQGISAYPASVIYGSGRYAANTVPYSNEAQLARIEENLKPEPEPWPSTLVEIAYAFMRLKQYSGYANHYPLALRYRKSEQGTKREREFPELVTNLNRMFDLFALDLRLPDDWQSLDEVAQRTVFMDILNGVRRQFGYYERPGLDPRMMQPVWMEDLLQKGFVSQVSGDPDELVLKVVAVKLTLPHRWPALEYLLSQEVRRILYHTELIQIIYNEAVSNRPPVYATTEADRRILEAPIPLIIASTNERTEGRRVFPHDPASQLVLPGKIRIGATGANVIVVRQRDKKALKKLLRELPVPITDLQIRADDTIF